MNIIKKIKNNIEYKKWEKVNKSALDGMKKHAEDEDDSLFRLYFSMNCIALTKMMELKTK